MKQKSDMSQIPSDVDDFAMFLADGIEGDKAKAEELRRWIREWLWEWLQPRERKFAEVWGALGRAHAERDEWETAYTIAEREVARLHELMDRAEEC